MAPSARLHWPAIFLATLVAGTLDLAYATAWSLAHGGSAIRLYQAIASGWLGRAAFDGGAASAALGVASHYAIIGVAAILFQAASLRLAGLRRHAVVAGLLYGAVIYLVMNFVVVPLSAAPFKLQHHWVSTTGDLASHLFGVGLVISLFSRRALASR